jgi:CDGSH-type Zn-finger protein
MSEVTIRLRDNGPLVVSGPVTIVDAEGNAFRIDEGKPGVALCRCGQSARKPFCDGAHKGCGFTSVERAPPDNPAP